MSTKDSKKTEVQNAKSARSTRRRRRDTSCPNCGSSDIKTIETPIPGTGRVRLDGFCFDCDAEW